MSMQTALDNVAPGVLSIVADEMEAAIAACT
jgi:hypothetical protein